MSEEKPRPRPTRVALTQKQAAEALGVELIELSGKWLADGKFDGLELTELQMWLAKVPEDTIPAIRFLKEEVARYLEDGEILPWELARLQAALMRIIPPDQRAVAKAARDAHAASEAELMHEVREAARNEDRAAYWQAVRARNKDNWTADPATKAQRDYIRDLGGSLPRGATKLDASQVLDRLLANEDTGRKGIGCTVIAITAAVIIVVLFIIAR
jgi:hypothetical protein